MDEQRFRGQKSRLTAAAKSNCPDGGASLEAPTLCGAVFPAEGRAAVGIGGLPGGLAAPGFAATGGGVALGFAATGGGALPPELTGREFAGVISAESLAEPAGFFQGAAEPFEGTIPGKTATGLADTSAAIDLTDIATLGAAGVEDAVGADGGGLRDGGGGGGGGPRGALGAGSR